ncbi:MAG: 1-acyl-sn-glycerol-3-phosphate acyltransferase [Candidatus Omnitrophica bacterium]|nr:1-acyl-sn-glycerol-3-phosphate acyltransferase [Candidatus Omnitrophota bacterium]
MSKTANSSNDGSFLSRGDVLSVFLWLGMFILTLSYSTFGILIVRPISFFIDKKLFGMHRIASWWASSMVTLNPAWRIEVSGREQVLKNKAYVIVANHQSIADIAAVLSALPLHFKFVAKKELYTIPFLGWHMALAGYMALDRSSRESGKNVLLESRSWLRRGVSVLFFPEGTRSLDGAIHAFKIGAFKLARDQKMEILPVVIDGTGDCIPKHTWKITKPSVFKVSIGKPVNLSEVSGEHLGPAIDAIREEMILRLAGLRQGQSV